MKSKQKLWLQLIAATLTAVIRAVFTIVRSKLAPRVDNFLFHWPPSRLKNLLYRAGFAAVLGAIVIASMTYATPLDPKGRWTSELNHQPLRQFERDLLKNCGMLEEVLERGEWPLGVVINGPDTFVVMAYFDQYGSLIIPDVQGYTVYLSPQAWALDFQGQLYQAGMDLKTIELIQAPECPCDGVANRRDFDGKAWIHVIAPAKYEHKNASDEQTQYVRLYAQEAILLDKLYNVPASITLGQGLLETANGTSVLMRQYNNHFGVKCHHKSHSKPVTKRVWKNGKWRREIVYSGRKDKKGNLQPLRRGEQIGHCYNLHDDNASDMFRAFKSDKDNFVFRGLFLDGTTPGFSGRYHHLTKIRRDDPKRASKWAHGLKKAGYATDRRYAQKLLKIIDNLDLEQFDQ